MSIAQRREPGYVLIVYSHTFLAQLLQYRLHIQRIPQHGSIDDQAKGAELVLLAFAVALSDFPSPTVKGGTGQLVSPFMAIKLGQDAASVALIIDKGEEKQGFRNAPQFSQGTG